jgi:phosphoserine aminotransferase
LIRRSEENLATVAAWVEKQDWIGFLAEAPETRSCTSICLAIGAEWFARLPARARAEAAKRIAGLLEQEGVAFDVGSYREAPPGLRIWGGATVERSDIAALLPWLAWAHAEVRGELRSG